MKIRITLAYRKITNERLDVALLSKDMDDNPDFAPLLNLDQLTSEVRDQTNRILQDKDIDDGPFTITIEAGK